MKQIIYRSVGAPSSVLEVTTVESQRLKSDDVRVSVLATPIHPSNLLKISAIWDCYNLPETLVQKVWVKWSRLMMYK